MRQLSALLLLPPQVPQWAKGLPVGLPAAGVPLAWGAPHLARAALRAAKEPIASGYLPGLEAAGKDPGEPGSGEEETRS